MAEILKRRHDLVAFKVALDAAGAEPRVRCTLEVTEGHVLRTEAEWECVPAELGLPARLEREQARGAIPLRLPPRLLDELRQRVFAAGRPAALWLHLVKPYAHLGVAPWDRVLTEALGLPVLRLPDFLVPPPRESPRTLDVALCVSRPRAKSPFDARRFVASIVGDVAAGVPRARVTVHLFTDADVYGEIRAAGGDNSVRLPAGSGTSGEVALWLHDPRDAARYAEPAAGGAAGGDVPGRIDNPWLLWMRDTLRGRCLDVVHFACHGYYALDRGAVALASTPARDDDEGLARFVGAAELDTFLTQMGAWAAAFSSPPGNFSDAGLRHLADDLAQRKPFATLYHDLAHDLDCTELALAYRFLYDPRPAQPEPMACVSIYCQPCRITGDVPEAPGEKPPASANDVEPGTAGGYEKSSGGGGSYGGGGGSSYGGGGQGFGVVGGASYGGGGLGSSGGGGSFGGGGSGSGGGVGSSGGGSYDGGVGLSGGGGFGGGGLAGSFDAGPGSDGGMDAGYGGGLESAGAFDGAAGDPEPDVPAVPPAWPDDELEAAGPPSAPSSAPAPAAPGAEAALAEVFRTADVVPTWLAAAQRFVEGHTWQVRQWEQGSTPAAPEQQAELEVTRQTLAQIQEVLARHATAAQAGRRDP